MKTFMIMLLTVMTAGSSLALVTLPEGGTGKTLEVEALLAKVEDGQEYILIDDMAFRIDTLQKSGFTGAPWPEGIVYYQFEGTVSSADRDRWRNAAWIWTQVANLTFIEGPGPPPGYPHIFVFYAEGNFSEVGWQGVPQDMGISDWHLPYKIAHEICHALGFVHEQSRTDRDDYVEIVLDNIQNDKEHNFEIRPTTNLTPYDFDSVMHYSAHAFIWPWLTCPPDCSIIVKEPWNAAWQDSIGQFDHLSEWDSYGMAAVYGAPCNGPIYVNYNSLLPQNGSFVYPFRFLSTAVDFACSNPEIVLFAGTHPASPILIDKPVRLKANSGTVLIE